MIIYPAIDIFNGDGVRLKKGKFSEVKVYGKPLELAKRWEEAGSKYLHVVDLNGARQVSNNIDFVKEIIKNTDLEIQFGGGIRSVEYAKRLLDLGIKRIILGTVAIKNIGMLKELINLYPDRIIVGIDAKDGKVAVEGWEEVSEIDSIDLFKKLEDIGVQYVVYTDIARDGMLTGPNFTVYEKLISESDINIIASGGITTPDDLIKLKEIGVYGSIVGKALYESKIDLKEVLNVD